MMAGIRKNRLIFTKLKTIMEHGFVNSLHCMTIYRVKNGES